MSNSIILILSSMLFIDILPFYVLYFNALSLFVFFFLVNSFTNLN